MITATGRAACGQLAQTALRRNSFDIPANNWRGPADGTRTPPALVHRRTSIMIARRLSPHGPTGRSSPPSRPWRRPTTRLSTLIRTSSFLFPPAGPGVSRLPRPRMPAGPGAGSCVRSRSCSLFSLPVGVPKNPMNWFRQLTDGPVPRRVCPDWVSPTHWRDPIQ